jgi:hypothetical protein
MDEFPVGYIHKIWGFWGQIFGEGLDELGRKFLYFIAGSKLESYFRLNWKLSAGKCVINCVLGEKMRETENTVKGGFRGGERSGGCNLFAGIRYFSVSLFLLIRVPEGRVKKNAYR